MILHPNRQVPLSGNNIIVVVLTKTLLSLYEMTKKPFFLKTCLMTLNKQS